jgi:hypothetical protein
MLGSAGERSRSTRPPGPFSFGRSFSVG